jgi:hypothetical protein
MPPGTLICRPVQARPQGGWLGIWAPIVAISAVFGCGRETFDLAISRSNAHGDGGVDAAGSRDGGGGLDSGPRGAAGITCGSTQDCFFGGVCTDSHRCECTSDEQCTTLFAHCDVFTKECVLCVQDSDCFLGGLDKCDPVLHQCTAQCTADKGCGLLLPVCNTEPARSLCVECVTQSDCERRGASDLTCRNGACVECSTNRECNGRGHCEPRVGRCFR